MVLILKMTAETQWPSNTQVEKIVFPSPDWSGVKVYAKTCNNHSIPRISAQGNFLVEKLGIQTSACGVA